MIAKQLYPIVSILFIFYLLLLFSNLGLILGITVLSVSDRLSTALQAEKLSAMDAQALADKTTAILSELRKSGHDEFAASVEEKRVALGKLQSHQAPILSSSLYNPHYYKIILSVRMQHDTNHLPYHSPSNNATHVHFFNNDGYILVGWEVM